MTRAILTAVAVVAVAAGCTAAPKKEAKDDGWISLFNGKDLAGWKITENPDSIRVVDGQMVMDGPRAHAFYVGPVAKHDFKNFEFQAEVFVYPKANSGIYFHTEVEKTGYPPKGHEAQINNTHSDPRKTGSLYAVQDLKESPVPDEKWFTFAIRVEGRRITFRIDGKKVNEWTEPEGYKHPQRPKRGLSRGTFALQGHDPKSKVRFRHIKVRLLPD